MKCSKCGRVSVYKICWECQDEAERQAKRRARNARKREELDIASQKLSLIAQALSLADDDD